MVMEKSCSHGMRPAQRRDVGSVTQRRMRRRSVVHLFRDDVSGVKRESKNSQHCSTENSVGLNFFCYLLRKILAFDRIFIPDLKVSK